MISPQFEVKQGEVDVGETYPLYGMITKFLDDTPGRLLVEINYSTLAELNVSDPKMIDTLKARAFDPAIFVSKVLTKSPEIRVECTSVIFGKRADYSA